MYLKLMLRGLLRHRQSGKRLFVLLGLCSTSMIFFLAFRDSFTARYQQLAIDTATAHLQVVPQNSPKIDATAKCTDHREGLLTMQLPPGLETFLRGLPQVDSMMLAVETKAAIFTAEGEPVSFTPALIGVDPGTFAATLPGVRVAEGSANLAWQSGMRDVPVLRPVLERHELVSGNDRFVRSDFRPEGEVWDRFKATVAAEMPALFNGDGLSDAAFVATMNRALSRDDLASLLPARLAGTYDYRVDDSLAALASAARVGGDGAAAAHRIKVLRKRLLESVYPDAITPVRDTIGLDIPYTMAVPPARRDADAAQEVLPVVMVAYVEKMPLYHGSYYVDARVLRERLGLGEREGTNLYVRLGRNEDTATVKAALEAELAKQGLDYVVRDYHQLGNLYGTTAAAFRLVTLILIVLFVVTVMVFIANTVLLSVARRRREIGTAIAIGLAPRQNIVIMLGEVVIIVATSWAVGATLAVAAVLALHEVGLPGIIFMPEGRLRLDFDAAHLAISLVVLLVSALAAAAIPLRRVAGVQPVDLLREAA